jgi:hypothetical protein
MAHGYIQRTNLIGGVIVGPDKRQILFRWADSHLKSNEVGHDTAVRYFEVIEGDRHRAIDVRLA